MVMYGFNIFYLIKQRCSFCYNFAYPTTVLVTVLLKRFDRLELESEFQIGTSAMSLLGNLLQLPYFEIYN